MKMKKKLISLSLFILLLVVVYFTFFVDEQNLGDNYYYLPRYESIDVGYPEGAIIYKSSERYVYSDVKVHGDVISVNSDEKYIIAIQNVDNSNNQKNEIEKTNSQLLKYFIIDKKSDLIYGPFSMGEFMKKSELLGVSKELQFQK